MYILHVTLRINVDRYKNNFPCTCVRNCDANVQN